MDEFERKKRLRQIKLRKQQRRRNTMIAIIAAAACVVALIIVMVVVGRPADTKKVDNNEAEEQTTESVTEETTTTTTAAATLTNPKDAEAAKALEKSAAHKVYLTFDDGPSANTDTILDTLKKNNIKATFFLIRGNDDEVDRARIKRIYDEGHTLAIHSTYHDYSQVYANMDSFKEDVTKEKDYLKELTGVDVRFYRFPGGSSNTVYKHYGVSSLESCADWIHEQGVEYYDWNVSTADSEGVNYTSDEIAHNVTDYIGSKKEYIVLLHDSAAKKATAQALQQIIDEINSRGGYTFCQITDDTVALHHDFN